jgi:hypothetical protein
MASQQIHAVSLSWQHAGLLGAVLFAGGLVLNGVSTGWLRALAPWLRECAIIAGLYALWQLAGRLSVMGTAGALARGRWILHAEHDVLLPSEHSVQNLIAGHATITQLCNLYYDTMHFTMLFVFLLWLFLRHREKYRPVRRVLAVTTLLCLLVQLLPVAPPRMLPGFTDTAQLYGQSVYAGGLAADQLSAMPSVHVAWAVLVGCGVVYASRSRWRWFALAHPVITIFAVVATANHYWADGIVAIALLLLSIGIVYAVTAGVRATRDQLVEPETLISPPIERILP